MVVGHALHEHRVHEGGNERDVHSRDLRQGCRTPGGAVCSACECGDVCRKFELTLCGVGKMGKGSELGHAAKSVRG